MIWLSVAVFLFFLCCWAQGRADTLDVQTGRRDGDDGYGSNRGSYWPWTPIIQASFVGVIVCFFMGISP